MKKTIITLIIFAGIIFLAGCSTNEDNSTKNQKVFIETKNDTKIEKRDNFPDYLKLENGELFCEYGDENNPKPDVGVLYSKQIIDIIQFPETLEIINFQYAKDKNNIYSYESTCTEGMPGSCSCYFYKLNLESDSFKVLDEHHIKDQNSVIVFGEEVKQIDAKSFELIKTKSGEKTPYGKDKNNIYHYGYIIEEADYSSFEVIDSVNAKDKNNFYDEGVLKN